MDEIVRMEAGVPGTPLSESAGFLLSPGVLEQLKTVQKPAIDLGEIIGSQGAAAAEAILTTPAKKRYGLAKLLKATAAKKRANTVKLGVFAPQDRRDIGEKRTEAAGG